MITLERATQAKKSARLTGNSSAVGAALSGLDSEEKVTHRGRRAFLSTAAMTLAAAELGGLSLATMATGASRQLAAVGGATTWLNSSPLSTTSLLGKPALVQFGTYTCINWLRTLPYVRAW